LIEISENSIGWSVGLNLLSGSKGDLNEGFFGANILYSKVRRHWYQLEAHERDQLTAAVIQLLQQNHGDSNNGLPFPYITMTKVCLLLAAISVRTPNGSSDFVSKAFSLFPQQIPNDLSENKKNSILTGRLVLMLKMLKSLTEEADAADISRALRLELEQGMNESACHVLKAIEEVMEIAFKFKNSPTECRELLVACFECFLSWIEFGTTFSTLYMNNNRLFELIIFTLEKLPGLPCDDGKENINEGLLLAPVLCETIESLVVVAEFPRPAKREVAINALISRLDSLKISFATGIQREDDELCDVICRTVTSIAEVEIEYIAGRHAPMIGLELVSFILAMSACPMKKMLFLTTEFWLQLQDLPLIDRHPSLANDVYSSLLDVILEQCEYPSDFSSWENHSSNFFDEDTFRDLRESSSGVKDVLIVIYYLLRKKYLEKVLHWLEKRNNSWQAIEACLLVISHTSKEAKSWIEMPDKNAEQRNDAEVTKNIIIGLIKEVLSNHQTMFSNSLVLKAGCKLLGAFPAFLIDGSCESDRGKYSLLVPALNYFLLALRKDLSVSRSVTTGIKSVCVVCEKALTLDNEASNILMGLSKFLTEVHIELEDQLLIAESVTRVFVSVEGSKASDLVGEFSAPLLQMLVLNLNAEWNSEGICKSLQIIGQIVRFLDTPVTYDGCHSSNKLLGHLIPILDQVFMTCKENEPIMCQFFSLVERVMSSLRMVPNIQNLLPSFLGTMFECYAVTHFPCCLDCMKVAVEIFCSEVGETAEHFKELFRRVCAETFNFVKQGHPPNSIHNLIASFFSLAYRYLLYRPSQILLGPDLPIIVELATVCLDTGAESLERESSRAVLLFVGKLAQQSKTIFEEYTEEIDKILLGKGGRLCGLILRAIALGSPSMLWANLIDCLYLLLNEYLQRAQKEFVKNWVMATVYDPSITAALSVQDRQNVAEAIIRLAIESKQRFKALMLDFAKICNHLMTADGLLAYYI